MALHTIIAQYSHVYMWALDAIAYARLGLSSLSCSCSYPRLPELAQREPMSLLGRNEMDPPLCGSTSMSHNDFGVR
jgi:hypothetical protein